jgi:multidrug resistance efflux pump
MFHDEVQVSLHPVAVQARAGDVLVHLDQPRARYAVETLEPQAHDSFFRWGFFNAILEKKEHFSDYVFEDTAVEMLRDEPALAAAFAQWKLENPQLLADQQAVLSFLYDHGQRHREPEWRGYPVVRLG